MDKLRKVTNDFSGLLSFISFLGLVMFWVFGMQIGLEGLSQDHINERLAQKEYNEKTILVLSEIRDSLKDKGTDHIIFRDDLNKNTISIEKVSEAVLSISYSLKSIDKYMDKINK